MNPQLNSIVDVVLDRSPEELIGTVFLALVLALGLAGLFLLLRRRVSDVSTLIICLALACNLVSMAVAGAFVRYRFTNGKRVVESLPPPGPRGPRFGFGEFRGMFFLSRNIMEAADVDSDGFLTANEAATAAARFVDEADVEGEGRLSQRELSSLIRHRLMPPPPGRDAAMVGPPMLMPPPGPPAASDATPEPPTRDDAESGRRSTWKPRDPARQP